MFSLFLIFFIVWDASAKTEFGVLYGNAYQGGNFDECLSIQEPFKTQYCGVTMRVELYEEYSNGNPYDLDPSPYDVVWKKLKVIKGLKYGLFCGDYFIANI